MHDDPLPARVGRAERARAGRGRPPRDRAAHGAARRRRAHRRRRSARAARRARRRGARARCGDDATPRVERRLRRPLPRPGARADRARPRPTPRRRRRARRVRGPARRALRLPRRGRADRGRHDPRDGERSPGPSSTSPAGDRGAAASARGATVVFGGEEHDAEIAARRAGARASGSPGPAICELPEATLAVPPGWAGSVDDAGTIVAGARGDVSLDPIDLQVVTGALRAACEEMGATLVRSAHSANIKERRDCSTALFDPAGEMVMQAEHIPVHLGAMPAAVAAVLDEDHAGGRPWILNDPYRGGTHLPDITVITPVLHDDGELLGFAASRAHHADVGGRVPGSMPADSTTLDEEGVVIAPRLLDDAAIDELVAQMRQPEQRRADLRAQLAANRIGARRLAELAAAPRRPARCARPPPRCSTTPSGARAPASPRCPTARARPATCSRRIEGDLELRLVGDRRRRPPDPRLRAAAPTQHAGQPQLPARRHALGGVLRRPRADRPRRPAERRRLPPDRGRRAGGLAAERARRRRAVAGGNVETSSRVADLVLAAFGARARPGHDEQPHARQRGLHLLRDARRRPGRVPRRRRPERRPRRDVQHAQHAGRGARARVPAARRALRDPPRLGRRRARTAAATASCASSRRSRRCPTR